MPYRFIIVCLTAILIQVPANGQADSIKVKDGIYFSLESLMDNMPDVFLSSLTPETTSTLFKESTLRLNCVNVLNYYDDKGNVLNVPASSTRLVVVGGNLFVSHEMTFKTCFEKLLTFGRLSRFFTRKDTEGGLTSMYSPNGPMPMYSPATVKVKEFIVDLSTGKIYNMNSERGKVRSIIKKDTRFAKVKISSNDIDYYIKQFNELNPIILKATN